MALPGCSPVQMGLGFMLKCHCLLSLLHWNGSHGGWALIHLFAHWANWYWVSCALSWAMRTRQPSPVSLKTSRCSYAQCQMMVNPGKSIKQDEEYCRSGDALPTPTSREVLTIGLQGLWPEDSHTSCLLWGSLQLQGSLFSGSRPPPGSSPPLLHPVTEAGGISYPFLPVTWDTDGQCLPWNSSLPMEPGEEVDSWQCSCRGSCKFIHAGKSLPWIRRAGTW